MDKIKADSFAVQARLKELAETEYVTKELARIEADYQLLNKTTHETIDQKIEKNQEHMADYLHKKFEAIQEKQFTVPKLVGEGL